MGESAVGVVADRPICPACGRRLKVKGKRQRVVVLETGEVTVARSDYHCPACQTGVFPLDAQWQMSESVCSPERAKPRVCPAGWVPYAQAAVFERIGHWAISPTSIWRETQAHGERLCAQAQHNQAHVAVERVVMPPAGLDHPQRQGVSLEGGLMNIRGESWKEFKVGTVYDVVNRAEKDPETGELIDQPHGDQMGYGAVLGSASDASHASALWALAVERQLPQAADPSVTADGTEWIWNLAADYFPDSVQIIDWYHATEHLAQVRRSTPSPGCPSRPTLATRPSPRPVLG